MGRRSLDTIFAALGSFLLVYITLPITSMILLQAGDLGSLESTLRDPEVISALENSVITATVTALLAIVLGVPLGYVLARKEFRGKDLVQGMVDVPIVIPHSVVGIALLTTFSSSILDNYLGIIAAMLFVSASFTVNAARDRFASIDERLEHVARTLGASKWRTFTTVTFPLSLPAILSGAIMTWARAISEVGALLVVAYYPKTAQILVLDYFEEFGLSASRPVAVLLVLMSLSVFVALRWSLARGSEGR